MAKEEVGVDVRVEVDGAKSLKDLKKDLKDAQGELIAISRQFGENSKQAQDAARRVAGLKDEIADAAERVKLFDPGAKFQALGNVVNTVTAGFTAAQGAMAIFGSESADLEKQLVKLQGALALSQGLSAITDSWKDFARLGGIIKTQVITAFTTLKGAIAATGIGLLVVALGTVIANFEKIEAWLKKVIPGFEGFGKVFNQLKAVAMGTFNAIVEGFRVVWDVISNLFTGDFSAAANAAFNAGSRIGKAYAAGFEQEVKDQAEEAARELLAARIQYQERELKVLRAGGERRAADAEALERKILQMKIDSEKAGTQARFDAEAELRAFDAAAAEERRKTAEENAKKAQEQRKVAGQKALEELKRQQELELLGQNFLNKSVEALKKEHYDAQLEMARRYGLDLKQIYDQQDKDEVERRKKQNDVLRDDIDTRAETTTTGLIAAGDAQKKFNEQVNAGIIQGQITIEEAEGKKQAAMIMTNEIMAALTTSNQELSGLQEGAAIALAFIVSSAEKQKIDALEASSVALKAGSAIIGKQTAVGKTMAIAATTIDTIQSGIAAFKGMIQTFPGPWGIAAGAAAAAGVLINGFAQVKKIRAVAIPGVGSQASAPGDMGFPSINAPSIQAANPTLTSQQQQGIMVDQLDQINTNMRQPQRIYVQESDITDTQARVAKIEQDAQF